MLLWTVVSVIICVAGLWDSASASHGALTVRLKVWIDCHSYEQTFHSTSVSFGNVTLFAINNDKQTVYEFGRFVAEHHYTTYAKLLSLCRTSVRDVDAAISSLLVRCEQNETYRSVSLKLTCTSRRCALAVQQTSKPKVEFIFHRHLPARKSIVYTKRIDNITAELWYRLVNFRRYVQMDFREDLNVLDVLRERFVGKMVYTDKLVMPNICAKNRSSITPLVGGQTIKTSTMIANRFVPAGDDFRKKCAFFYAKDNTLVCRYHGRNCKDEARVTILSDDADAMQRSWSVEQPTAYGTDAAANGERIIWTALRVDPRWRKVFVCECLNLRAGNSVVINAVRNIDRSKTDEDSDVRIMMDFIVSSWWIFMGYLMAIGLVCVGLDIICLALEKMKRIIRNLLGFGIKLEKARIISCEPSTVV